MIKPALPQGYDALSVIVCGGVCAYTMLIIERVALEGGPRARESASPELKKVAQRVSFFSRTLSEFRSMLSWVDYCRLVMDAHKSRSVAKNP